MEFVDQLLPAGQLCLVPGQVSADYMEWFFRISHPFMTPTQAGDQQRDAPAADPEDYIQPLSPFSMFKYPCWGFFCVGVPVP